MLSAAEWDAIRLSVGVAVAAVAGSLPFGLVVAWVLARRDFRGKLLLETIVNLPLVLPPVVTGYLLLITFSPGGAIGSWLESWFGVRIVFHWSGAAIAAAVVAFPLLVRSMRVAFAMGDRRLEGAARTLGAGPVDVFFSVTLPLARHGVITGCVLAFARSIGEFGATIMIAGSIPGATRTIPLFIFDLLQAPGGTTAAARIIVVSVVISAAALLLSQWLERRAAHGGTPR